MSVTVRLPGALRDAVGGDNKVSADGRTLGEVFADIERRHPGFRSRVLDDDGRLRTYVNVYVGEADVRASAGLDTPVPAGAEVMVIPAMAGGAPTTARERAVIPRAVQDEILEHAREADGLECCGLVAAKGGTPTRVIRCANAAATPAIRYRIDPREQLTAFRAMDDAGEELYAIYHSHPASTPYPSATDRIEAFYPDALYLLASWRAGAPELRAYRIRADSRGSDKTVTAVDIAGS